MDSPVQAANGRVAEPMAAMLRVRLLGELDLRLGDDQLPPIESARARSLLGYLLLHRDASHSRQYLAFLLWPDSTEAQARTNLRKVLHVLRHEVPEIEPYLEVTPRTLRWRGDELIWIDAAAFEAALARAEDADGDTENSVVALRSAVDLYRGDLLEGCYDEWLVEERERFRDWYRSALKRLTGLLARRRDYAEAIRFGRELLRSDPLQEDAYRLLMRTYDAAGDRAGAVRVYHECTTTLQRELGVQPSPATREAYAALTRAEQLGVDADQEPLRLAGPVLVGRHEEWERLTRLWRDAEGGHPQLVLVTGEPGVGKTRLVEELSVWCAHRGAVVAHARSYPTEGELGCGVVISWLRDDEVASRVRSGTPSELAPLARLVPELVPTPAPMPDELEETEQRRRLFDAVARALRGSDERPTLLVGDDAHWSDRQSLALIHYLVRLEPSRPTLVVATARPEELDERHPLSAVMSGLHAINRTTEIALRPLSRDDTAALARHLDFEPTSVGDLYAETEGNPLFIVETIRAVREGAGDGRRVSPKLQAVVSARLQRCSDPAGQVLAMAATVGRAFTADLVGGASGVDDLTLVRALDELWRRGLLREHGVDGYDFSHGKIRDVAYDALSPPARRHNHLLVAEALQRLHGEDVSALSGQVAGHYERAGQIEEAVGWYQRAAAEAQRLYSNVEAVRLLERAHELTAELPERARLRRELEILSALPAALVGVEDFASDRVHEAQRRAVEVARILGVELEPPLLRSLVMASLCRHDFDGAHAAAAQLCGSAERRGDSDLIVEGDYLLGIAAFWAGRLEKARAHFERVVDCFDPERRGAHLVRFGHDPAIVCLSRLGNTLWFLGRADEARRARDEAVAMATELGHPYSRGAAYIFAVLLSIDLGENDRIREYVGVLHQEHQALPGAVFMEALDGYVDVLDGGGGAGIARIRAAIDSCGPVDPAPGGHACLIRVLVAAHDAAHDAEGGVAAADEALRVGCSRLWEAETRRLRAEFLTAIGAPRVDVEAELLRAEQVAHRQRALGVQRRIEHSRSCLGLG